MVRAVCVCAVGHLKSKLKMPTHHKTGTSLAKSPAAHYLDKAISVHICNSTGIGLKWELGSLVFDTCSFQFILSLSNPCNLWLKLAQRDIAQANSNAKLCSTFPIVPDVAQLTHPGRSKSSKAQEALRG